MCIVYRTLNRRTIPDQYTVPRIENALQCLSGAKWCSVLDLKIPCILMSEGRWLSSAHWDSSSLMAVWWHDAGTGRSNGHLSEADGKHGRRHEFDRGTHVFGDIIIFGNTLEDTEAWLEKVFQRLNTEPVVGEVSVLSDFIYLLGACGLSWRSGHRPTKVGNSHFLALAEDHYRAEVIPGVLFLIPKNCEKLCTDCKTPQRVIAEWNK